MIDRLCRMLGVRERELEDALRSEKRARLQLSRRGLLAAGAAAVTASLLPEKAYSFASPPGIVVRAGEMFYYSSRPALLKIDDQWLPDGPLWVHRQFYETLVRTTKEIADFSSTL